MDAHMDAEITAATSRLVAAAFTTALRNSGETTMATIGRIQPADSTKAVHY
jgi:hypothetical protein